MLKKIFFNTLESVIKLIDEYNSGVSCNKLGFKYDCTYQTIVNTL
jgi:hypothetical protein